MTDYGPLAGLVASVGALLSAGAAITLAWKRKANWAPPEDDVPTAPKKVAAVVTMIAIALLWFEAGKTLVSRDLEIIAGVCGAATIVFLLIYSFLMGVYVYRKEVTVGPQVVEQKRTIGGLWLRGDARAGLKKAKTVQRLFSGSGYDPDLVWSRGSRALAKNLFIVSFIGLQFFGSVAVSSIALSVDPTAVAPSHNRAESEIK